MPVSQTSKKAYREIIEEGGISRQKALILSVMRDDVGYSLQELSRLSGLQINAVSGRVNELKRSFRVIPRAKRKCSITNRLIVPVSLLAGW